MSLSEKVLPADRALAESPVPFNFQDVRTMAANMLRGAHRQAQQMLDSARQQVAALEKKAHDEGFAKGLEEGREKGLAEGRKKGEAEGQKKAAEQIEAEKNSVRATLAPAIEVFAQTAGLVAERHRELIAQAESDMLLLLMDLARRIVGAELAVRPEVVAAALHETIGLIPQRTELRVRVNPEDAVVLEAELPALGLAFPDLGTVHFEVDPNVERGGVVALTREGEVDMRLSTRLKAFEQAMLGVTGDAALPPWEREVPPPAIVALPPPAAAPTDNADNTDKAAEKIAPPAAPATPSMPAATAAPESLPEVSASSENAFAAIAAASGGAPVALVADGDGGGDATAAAEWPPIDPETGLPEGMSIEEAIELGLISQEEIDAAIAHHLNG